MFRNLALALVSVAIALAIAELTCRWMFGELESQRADLRMARADVHVVDPELGWVPRANARGRHPLPFNGETTVSTDSEGLRVADATPRRVGATVRIAAVGDSFTWGWGVEAEETFAGRLGADLADVDVANLGVIGYGTRQERLYFRRFGAELAPDAVVLSFCANDVVATTDDFVARGIREQRHAARAPAQAPVNPFAPYALRTLARNFVDSQRWLGQLAVDVGLREGFSGYEALDENLRPFLVDYPDELDAQWQTELTELLAFRDEVQATGATLLVAVIPVLQTVDQRALDASLTSSRYRRDDFDVDRLYRSLASFARENGIAIVTPVAEFRAAAARGEQLYLNRDMHFNAAGHRLFANAIEGALAQMTWRRPNSLLRAHRAPAPQSSRSSS